MTTPLPVLPQIIVEAGLTSGAPVQAAPVLLLGDATRGQLNVGTLGDSVFWTSISPYVRSFTVTRPSTRLQGPLWNFQAATASILLDNSDGRFDPDNLGGPYVTGGPASMTVTATQTGTATKNGTGLAVLVFNDALPPASQAGVTASGNTTTLNATVTPHAIGSQIVTAIVSYASGSGSFTWPAGQASLLNAADATNGEVAGFGELSAITTSTGAITVGPSAGPGPNYHFAAAEILGSTSNSLNQDASTPAPAYSTGISVTSPSFTPPAAGALLVAMALANTTASGTQGMTISDTMGLTWTQLVINPGGFPNTGIWVAQVPADTSAATQLTAMVPVRVRANFGSFAYPLFSGFADGWIPAQVAYEGGYAELTLPATDAFKVLAGITLPAVAIEGGGADTGARIRDILTRANWYTTAERNVISTGNSTLQGTTLGSDALSLMQVAADSEVGQLYVNGSGAVVFRARRDLLTDTRSSTVQAVFGDLPGTVQVAGTELAYAAVSRASDDTTLVNDIQATVTGGTPQEAKDSASIAKYLFPRTYARSDLILEGDSDALVWASWVLYIGKDGSDRIDSLQVDPQADPLNLWPQVLGREIGDRIQVWQRPAGTSEPVSKNCFITGITHAWDSVASTWLTTWTLTDASKYGNFFFTLNDAVLGKLGSNPLVF